MSDTSIWIAIVGLTVVTLLSRALFLLAGTRVNIPHHAQRAMRYAPGAALVALISPELFTVGGNVSMDSLDPLQNPKLVVALITGVLFFHKRNMLLMIISGMLLFALLRCFPFS